jgi:outer membrane protein TolC
MAHMRDIGLLTVVLCGLMGGSALGQSPLRQPVWAQAPLSSAAAAQARSPALAVELGTTVELTLRDAIERALKDNLEIGIERYGLDLGALRISEARGAYDPLAGFSIDNAAASSPATSLLQGENLASEKSSSRSFAPTISQLLPTGGSVNASFSNSRASTNNTFSFVDPLYSSGLTIGFEQPLLRGLFSNPVRKQLTILNLDAQITDSQFRQAVAEIVLRVQAQYWGLAYALQTHAAQEVSRDLAVKQRDQISQKVQAGLLAPVALTSANAEVAIRDQEVLQAEVLIVAGQNGLKQLLASDPAAPLWRQRLVPIDRPEIHAPPATLNEALQTALARRPELASIELQGQQQEVERNFASWETMPKVNVSGDVTSVGRAGQVFAQQFDADGGLLPTGRVLDPNNPLFGGYQEAWDQVFGNAFPNWRLRLEVQMPIFNRSSRARLAQVNVSRRQLETRKKAQQQSIMVEVANAYETVVLQRKVLDVARLSRELSEEQVSGETSRFEAGFTTNFEVLRYQRDLSEARVRELRAMVDYQIAIAALQKAVGISLDANDLALARSPH